MYTHGQLQHGKNIECLKFRHTKFAFLPPFSAIWKTQLFLMLALNFFLLRFLFQAL